jgi:hypothetical protein
MNIEYKEFFGIYTDVYPQGYCQNIISEFERLKDSGAGTNRLKGENAPAHVKNDYQIMADMGIHGLNKSAVDEFFRGLQSCFEEYTSKFSVLKDGQIRGTAMKMQRTDPGGGYHVWHGEQGSGVHANRVLVYMLYLNTLDPASAGETEFLYQQTRFRPIENTMLIWPAAYTHAHRGNTVFGNTSKYVITGWFYYD